MRVMSVSRQPLFEAVTRKRFCPELYYRLNVVHIKIPPLRDRREDVPALLDDFLDTRGDGRTMLAETVSDDALQVADGIFLAGQRARARGGRQTPGADLRGVAESMWECSRAQIVNDVRAPARPVHEELFERLLRGQSSFWPCVYEPFMAHDLSRRTLRELLRLGVEHSGSDYRALAATLRVPDQDYRRFLAFLRKYHCLYPLMRLRPARATLRSRARRGSRSA